MSVRCILNFNGTEVTALSCIVSTSEFECKGLCLHVHLTIKGSLGSSHLHKSPLCPPTVMFLLLVSSLVLIKLLCFLLQWVRLLQCIHPSPHFQLPWDPTSHLPTDKHLIIYQTWIGAVFLFLGSLPQGAVILSLMKTVTPAERNSAYGPNTAYVVLALEEIFFSPFNLFFNRAQWIRLRHSAGTWAAAVVSFR